VTGIHEWRGRHLSAAWPTASVVAAPEGARRRLLEATIDGSPPGRRHTETACQPQRVFGSSGKNVCTGREAHGIAIFAVAVRHRLLDFSTRRGWLSPLVPFCPCIQGVMGCSLDMGLVQRRSTPIPVPQHPRTHATCTSLLPPPCRPKQVILRPR